MRNLGLDLYSMWANNCAARITYTLSCISLNFDKGYLTPDSIAAKHCPEIQLVENFVNLARNTNIWD